MNDKFDELAKDLAQSVTSRQALRHFGIGVSCGLLAILGLRLAQADELKLGPLAQVSLDPSPFAACDPGSFPGPTPDFQSDNEEKETFVAVNPTNPKNIVAIWIGGKEKGNVAGVSFDGGRRWQNVVIPSLTKCSEGTFQAAVDPWVCFAPNGDLYQISLTYDRTSDNHGGILVSKSANGGLRWTSPATLAESMDKFSITDKPSITADPADARFVYAIWDQEANGNRGQAMFSRTTDSGQTWEPARVIYAPGSDYGTFAHQILVLPNGTLVDLLDVYKLSAAGERKEDFLRLIRSTDRGQNWSAPVLVANLPKFDLSDPETGQLVLNAAGCGGGLFDVAVDANSGNLYAVWEDNRFSGGQNSEIAFSMSADGGVTWSAPIPVNQTPANTPPANRQAFLPSVAVAADGTIAVTYYDFRFNTKDPGLLTNYWLAICHPPGASAPSPASWGNEQRLTRESFDIEKASVAFCGGLWVGDYQGLAAAGSDFLAVWSQPHGTDPDDIFFRRIGP